MLDHPLTVFSLEIFGVGTNFEPEESPLVHIKNIKVSCNPLGLFFRVVSGYMKVKYTFKTDQLSFFSRGGHIL